MKTFAKVLVFALVMGVTAPPISSQEKEEKKVERATNTGWAVELFDHFLTAVNLRKFNEARMICSETLNERWSETDMFRDFFGNELNSDVPIPDEYQFHTWTRLKEVIAPDGNSFRFSGRLISKNRKVDYKAIMVKEEGSGNRWRIDSVLLKPVE